MQITFHVHRRRVHPPGPGLQGAFAHAMDARDLPQATVDMFNDMFITKDRFQARHNIIHWLSNRRPILKSNDYVSRHLHTPLHDAVTSSCEQGTSDSTNRSKGNRRNRQNHQKDGAGQDSFSGLSSSFSRLTRKRIREVVGERGGPWDGISPKVCVHYGTTNHKHSEKKRTSTICIYLKGVDTVSIGSCHCTATSQCRKAERCGEHTVGNSSLTRLPSAPSS